MTKIGKINAKLTSSAREEMLGLLSRAEYDCAILGIMKGRSSGEVEEHIGYGLYSPEQIKELAPEFENQGYSLLYELDGLTVVMCQFHLLEELEGMVIDIEKGRLVARGS